MRFEERLISKAEGWTLAHSVKVGKRRLPKGTVLQAEHISLLHQHGTQSVHAFLLESADIAEDIAAAHIATHIAGDNIQVGHAHKGRCNLLATANGLLLAGKDLNLLNQADEALTVATLPPFSPVHTGQLVATAKVIPYAVSATQLAHATGNEARISVAPFSPFSARLLTSGAELPDKVRRLSEQRLEKVQGSIETYHACPHNIDAVCRALQDLSTVPCDMILLLGLSAISDRRDVLPSALEKAGGEVIQFGMPVDPGNLLMLGKLGEKTVLGLPGCARSPALNGLDWVLERFAARLPLDPAIIRSMGIGGLLKETTHRPEPRAPRTDHAAKVHAIVLAAGRARRAGGTNKLLRKLNGKSVILETTSTIMQTTTARPIVVTGHNHDAIEKALSGYAITITHNTLYEEGMASSLLHGLRALDAGTPFALICLGDMPFIRPDSITALTDTAAKISEARIFIPTFNNKRGHPVLWHRSLFPELMAISGDKGGREVIHANEHLVCEVPVTDPGILIDLDTPAAMAQFGIEDG